jgi:hypothetical protein
MAGIGIWVEGATPDNIILPLILMGVEITASGNVRDYYYTLWTQDVEDITYWCSRLYSIMGWDDDTPSDTEALSLAMCGARALRAEYIALWDMYYPTLHLARYGCHYRRRLRELVQAMPVRPPFIASKPYRHTEI